MLLKEEKKVIIFPLSFLVNWQKEIVSAQGKERQNMQFTEMVSCKGLSFL